LDTQPAAETSALQSRIDTLVSTYNQYKQRLTQVNQERENILASLYKIEGALEALTDYKSTSELALQKESPKSDKENGEMVNATYTKPENDLEN
jgi:predicted  nucleic acid-binding Zn-ribbon protein